MEKKTIGAFIAALRKANGLTQKQLADKLCVSDKAVSRWERDETLPDLTLIPVMAEIFGVTSDELLRGQRANPEAPLPDTAPEKSEKQLRRIIAAAKTKFKIQSIISVAVAFTGLLAAMICNFAFGRAYLGLLLGCVFYSAGTVCQVIFAILARSRMEAEELAQDAIASVWKYLYLGNELVFSAIAMLLAISLPLIFVPDKNWFLTVGSFAMLSLLFGAACATVCCIVCLIINIRKGYQIFSPKTKLRLLTITILIPVLGVTWLGHYSGTNMLYERRYLLAGHERYDSRQSLQEFLDTLVFFAVTPSGDCYIDPKDGTYYYHTRSSKWFYSYTQEQANAALRRYQIITFSLFAIYPIEITAAILIYCKKARALPTNT